MIEKDYTGCDGWLFNKKKKSSKERERETLVIGDGSGKGAGSPRSVDIFRQVKEVISSRDWRTNEVIM